MPNAHSTPDPRGQEPRLLPNGPPNELDRSAPDPDATAIVPAFHGDRCAAYLAGTEGAPPRELLLRALGLLGAGVPLAALDLGCGPGRELPPLIRAGLSVTAVDPYPEMIARSKALLARECPAAAGGVRFIEATLEACAADLRPSAFGLVHAGFVLPFVLPARFGAAFDALSASIAPGGLLVAQFFGPDDEFIRTAVPGTMTSHTASDVARLLEGFSVLHHEEVNREGNIGRGRVKWWHVHHVIARRRADERASNAG